MAPSILGLASAILGIPTITTFIQNLISALTRNSEYIENVQCTRNQLQEFEDEDLLDKMSILLTPTGYSDGSLNTIIPPYQVLPTELVTNGNFDTDSNWTATNSTISISNGVCQVNPTATFGYLNSTSSFQTGIGKKYVYSFDCISRTGSGNVYLQIGTFQNGNNVTNQNIGDIEDNTSYNITFTATSTTSYLRIGFGGSGTSATIDNVSIKEIQEADFDFSRGSSATRVNEQGLVEDVQILSGELVQNGNFEEIGSELVTNGNFETDSNWVKGTGWSISDGKAISDGVSSNSNFSQTNILTLNKVYKVSVNVVLNSGTLNVYVTALPTKIITSSGLYTFYGVCDRTDLDLHFKSVNFDGSIDNVSVKEVGQNWSFGTGWSMGDGVALFDSSGNAGYLTQSGALEINKKYKLTATVNSGIVSLVGAFYDVEQGAQIQTGVDSIFTVKSANGNVLRLYSHPNNGDAEITDISVVEITDDTDLPRIDYSPYSGAGTCGHLLLEPQRTNFVTYSEDFSQWSTAGTITVESGYLAPDGSTNAYKITDGAPSNNATALFLVGVAAADNARTIWAKTVSGTGTANLCSHNSNTNNLFTITNEWQRFEVNYATGIGTNNFYGVDFRDSGTLTEILIWGAQTEVGDYATSYIPTSGSTVTRSADVANNSGNADLFNDSEGVLYSDISFLESSASANNQLSLSDGSSDNRIMIYPLSNTQLGLRFNANGSQLVTQAVTVSSLIVYSKIAIKWGNGNYSLYQNGSEIYTQTIASTPIGLDKLNLSSVTGTGNLKAEVKCVAVFKEALSNNDLELLTGEGYNSFAALAAASNYNVI